MIDGLRRCQYCCVACIQKRYESELYVSDPSGLTHHAVQRVVAERKRQDEQWGIQRHSWPEWITILTEEVGEAAQEACKEHFHPAGDLSRLKEELVQVAAVAVAMVEHIEEMESHR